MTMPKHADKTAAQRQRRRRERMREAGLVPVLVYVYPEARAEVRQFVDEVNHAIAIQRRVRGAE